MCIKKVVLNKNKQCDLSVKNKQTLIIIIITIIVIIIMIDVVVQADHVILCQHYRVNVIDYTVI